MQVLRSLGVSAAASLVAVLLSGTATMAQDDTGGPTPAAEEAVQSLLELGENFKVLLRPEIGFPEDYVEHWQAAVDDAFAPDLISADYFAALETELSDTAREAGIEYEASPLGQALLEIAARDRANPEDVDLDETRAWLDTLSEAETSVYVDTFDGLQGPELADIVMDFYFEAMVVGATPIIGEAEARQWVAGSGALRDQYVDDYFINHVWTARQLSAELLEDYLAAPDIPGIIGYTEAVNAAWKTTLQSAGERLEASYSDRTAEN